MNEVSTFRLYLLRATYLFIFVGLAVLIWPGVLDHPNDLEHMRGVVRSLLTGVSLLALLGIRYPLQMLPLLFFEVIWKSVWLLFFGLPLRSADAFTPGTLQTWYDCIFTVPLFLIAIPWPYVWEHYVRKRGERWGRSPAFRRAEAG